MAKTERYVDMTTVMQLYEVMEQVGYPDHIFSNADRLAAAKFLAENGVTVQQWIPCYSGNLPKTNEPVLACTNNGNAFSARYDPDKKRWSVSHSVKITHWMPKPKPPKEIVL